MAHEIQKNILLHPLKSDGTYDNSIDLYPKTTINNVIGTLKDAIYDNIIEEREIPTELIDGDIYFVKASNIDIEIPEGYIEEPTIAIDTNGIELCYLGFINPSTLEPMNALNYYDNEHGIDVYYHPSFNKWLNDDGTDYEGNPLLFVADVNQINDLLTLDKILGVEIQTEQIEVPQTLEQKNEDIRNWIYSKESYIDYSKVTFNTEIEWINFDDLEVDSSDIIYGEDYDSIPAILINRDEDGFAIDYSFSESIIYKIYSYDNESFTNNLWYKIDFSTQQLTQEVPPTLEINEMLINNPEYLLTVCSLVTIEEIIKVDDKFNEDLKDKPYETIESTIPIEGTNYNLKENAEINTLPEFEEDIELYTSPTININLIREYIVQKPSGYYAYKLEVIENNQPLASYLIADSSTGELVYYNEWDSYELISNLQIEYNLNYINVTYQEYFNQFLKLDKLIKQTLEQKLATILPPIDTTTDGTYVLKAVVSDGQVTYTWVLEI